MNQFSANEQLDKLHFSTGHWYKINMQLDNLEESLLNALGFYQ